jgi:membrane protease YdiL (CAAX protease family)
MPWPAAGWGLYRHQSAALAFVGYHTLCLIGGLILRSPGLPPPPARLYTFPRPHLFTAIVLANGFTLLIYALVGGALFDRPHVLALLDARGLPPQSYVWLFPYFAIVNPLAEEIFWRGGVYATLRHMRTPWVWTAILTSFFFGAWHWLVIRLFLTPPIAICSTVVIMGIGFALTAVYERTRRLAYSIILHALAGDVPLLLLLLLLSRG